MRQIVNLCDGLRGAAAMLCPCTDMQDDPLQQALSQLEAAIDRLDSVARPAASDARLAAIEARHNRLRDGAAEALARLDRLIGTAAPRPESD